MLPAGCTVACAGFTRPHERMIWGICDDSPRSTLGGSRSSPLCRLVSCCVTDAYRPGDSRHARSAQFENAHSRREFKAVMNVSSSLVPESMSFQCLWAERSFCGPFRTDGPIARSNGQLPKRGDIDALTVDRSCFEGPSSVDTVGLQWTLIDVGGRWSSLSEQVPGRRNRV